MFFLHPHSLQISNSVHFQLFENLCLFHFPFHLVFESASKLSTKRTLLLKLNVCDFTPTNQLSTYFHFLSFSSGHQIFIGSSYSVLSYLILSYPIFNGSHFQSSESFFLWSSNLYQILYLTCFPRAVSRCIEDSTTYWLSLLFFIKTSCSQQWCGFVI